MRHFRIFLILIIIFCVAAIPSYANQEVKSLDEISLNTEERNKDFINGINEAGNMASTDIQGAEEITSAIKYIAAWIVQVLSYTITCLLVVRIVLDLAYIALPFLRKFLNRGQPGAGEMQGSMIGGQQNPRYGSINQGTPMGDKAPSSMQIQWISNAAINAVEQETNGNKAFRLYVKEMIVVLVFVPVLITLTVTGTLTNLGFTIGGALVSLLSSLESLM